MNKLYHRTSINGRPIQPAYLYPGTVHRAYKASAQLFMFLHPDEYVTQNDPWKVITTLNEGGTSVEVKYYDAISERFCTDDNFIASIRFDYIEEESRWRQIDFRFIEDFENYYQVSTHATDDEIRLAMELSFLRECREG